MFHVQKSRILWPCVDRTKYVDTNEVKRRLNLIVLVSVSRPPLRFASSLLCVLHFFKPHLFPEIVKADAKVPGQISQFLPYVYFVHQIEASLLTYTATTTCRSTSVDSMGGLFLQPTLSSITAGKQSLGTPVSASSTSRNVRACAPMLLCNASFPTKPNR